MPVEKRTGKCVQITSPCTVIWTAEENEYFILGYVDTLEEFISAYQKDQGPIPKDMSAPVSLRKEEKCFRMVIYDRLMCCGKWFDIKRLEITPCPSCGEKYNHHGQTYEEFHKDRKGPPFISLAPRDR